jgi:hypothetical protein
MSRRGSRITSSSICGATPTRRRRFVRRLVLLPLTVVGLLWPAGSAAAETTVPPVKGNVIKITMTVDVVGAADKHPTAPDGQPLVDYWNDILQNTWGAAFNRLPYKGCFKLELEVKFKARKANFGAKDGNHRIIVGAASGGSFEGTGFEGAPETSRNSRTGDGTRSFEGDRDGALPEDAPPTVVAHEFGHLFGLGDDRANGAPKNGRDGTMMVGGVPGVDVNVVQKIDQDLVNRIGEAIKKHLENQGKKLPKCEVWEGTFTGTEMGGECVLEVEGSLSLVVAKDGTVTGAGERTDTDTGPGCGGAVTISVSISGRATDRAFEIFGFTAVDGGPFRIPKSGTRARRDSFVTTTDPDVYSVELRCVRHCGEPAVG